MKRHSIFRKADDGSIVVNTPPRICLTAWTPSLVRPPSLHGHVYYDPRTDRVRTAMMPLNLVWALGLWFWWKAKRGLRLRKDCCHD